MGQEVGRSLTEEARWWQDQENNVRKGSSCVWCKRRGWHGKYCKRPAWVKKLEAKWAAERGEIHEEA